MIEIRQCRKSHSGLNGERPVQILDGIDLHARPHEFVAVLGPSGCGKTTLLKIVAGLIGWDSGDVIVSGRPVTGPGHDRAMVFQDFALLPWATVLDNVAFGLTLRGLERPAREARAAELIEAVGLHGFDRHYPYQLSGGMQQRVGLARALAVDPEILLLDEPFSSLDSLTRRALQEDVLRLHEGMQKTILLVTHSVDEAARLGDRVVLLSARPARVVETIEVGLPRPRPPHVSTDARFVELKEYLWSRVRALP